MRVVFATILGVFASWGVNMWIIQFFMPMKVEEGVDQAVAMEIMMESFTATDYLIPLSAHILGVLSGLIVARLICMTSNIPIWIVGGLHMLGTVIATFMFPAPLWFNIIDLVLPILIILFFLRTKKSK